MADKPNMTEITSFDKTKLRKTETQEKNPLPTKESEYLILKQWLRMCDDVMINIYFFIYIGSYFSIKNVWMTVIPFRKPIACEIKQIYFFPHHLIWNVVYKTPYG